MTCLFAIIYMGISNPFEQKNVVKVEYINEQICLLLYYLQVAFTDYVSQPAVKEVIGYFTVMVILIAILLNISIIVYSIGDNLVVQFKKYRLKEWRKIHRFRRKLYLQRQRRMDLIQKNRDRMEKEFEQRNQKAREEYQLRSQQHKKQLELDLKFKTYK